MRAVHAGLTNRRNGKPERLLVEGGAPDLESFRARRAGEADAANTVDLTTRLSQAVHELGRLGTAGNAHGFHPSLFFLRVARVSEGGEKGLAMSGTKVEPSRDLLLRGNRITIDGARIDRAAKRADWAGRALEYAAEDLQEGSAGDGGFEGLTELVLDQAGRALRLAEDIESRKDDLEAT
jgi:hypothetical protein